MNRGDSNEYTQYTIFNIKRKINLSYLISAAMGFFLGTQARVRNSHVRRAISNQTIEVLLYSVEGNIMKIMVVWACIILEKKEKKKKEILSTVSDSDYLNILSISCIRNCCHRNTCFYVSEDFI